MDCKLVKFDWMDATRATEIVFGITTGGLINEITVTIEGFTSEGLSIEHLNSDKAREAVVKCLSDLSLLSENK